MTRNRLRFCVQIAFLALTLVGVFVFQANCEKWCPFGGVESIYTYVSEGASTCSLSVSNFYILGGVLLATLLVGRAFCGYACPLGTIGRLCDMFGNDIKPIRRWKRRLRIPKILDATLSTLKYGIAVLIIFLTWKTGELVFRAVDPCYALLSRHGEDITFWAYIVSAVLIVMSMVMTLPFCRWFCPFAAVLNPFAAVSGFRVKRNPDSCTHCGKCRQSCPMQIPVDTNSGGPVMRCIACSECVSACPENAKRTDSEKTLQSTLSQTTVLVVLLVCLMTPVILFTLFPLASFTKARGDRPVATESVTLKIEGLTCRGTANKLWFYLERDDLFELSGYLMLEAWPAPDLAGIRVTFDPSKISKETICRAVTEPYVNFGDATSTGQIMYSPFIIRGYDPMATDHIGDL